MDSFKNWKKGDPLPKSSVYQGQLKKKEYPRNASSNLKRKIDASFGLLPGYAEQSIPDYKHRSSDDIVNSELNDLYERTLRRKK